MPINQNSRPLIKRYETTKLFYLLWWQCTHAPEIEKPRDQDFRLFIHAVSPAVKIGIAQQQWYKPTSVGRSDRVAWWTFPNGPGVAKQVL